MRKRQHERYTPKSLISAVNAMDDEVLGSIVNISLGGFMLASHGDVIPEGAIYQLMLQPQDADIEINMGATCLWQTEANAADSYWAGFQIIDISTENEALLKSYIESLEG